MEWIKALVLGAVQGVTEFLPVSSDGHLLLTQKLFDALTGRDSSGKDNLFFDVMLHVGTLAAIVVYFRAVAWTGARGLLGDDQVPPAYRRGAVIRTGLLAVLATTPLVPLKLFFMKWIEATYDSLTADGIGFLITATVLLVGSYLQRPDEKGKGPAETTWVDALVIGLAQMFAPLPGVSRSGLTVAAGLARGLSRSWAVGFSLLIAVPAILGASVMELKDLDRSTLQADRVAQIVAAAALAGVVGYGAIVWLVKVVRSGRMWYFSVYLVVVGVSVLLASAAGVAGKTPATLRPAAGASSDARVETAADRPALVGAARPAD
jgi:undecaprenyl-diphosphatase